MMKKIAAAAVALIALSVTAACSSNSGASSNSSTSASASSGSEASSPAAAGSKTTANGTATCDYIAGGSAAKKVNLPPTKDVSDTGTVTATMVTASGTIVMDLNRKGTPCAVNSFVSLANQKYFDATSCHRLVPNFVLQCGDPTGTGSGGPGYSFKDELSGHETYPRGTVAMANAGPNTNGSQFFIVLQNAQLPPSYDVMGTVTSDSMSVVEKIAAQGVDPNDPQGIKPKANTTISSLTVN